MQYQGGKSRIAKNISEVIINEVSRWKEQNRFDNCGSYQREREGERERVTRHACHCVLRLVQ